MYFKVKNQILLLIKYLYNKPYNSSILLKKICSTYYAFTQVDLLTLYDFFLRSKYICYKDTYAHIYIYMYICV